MRAIITSLVATSALALSACNMDRTESAIASSAVVPVMPDYLAAVSAPGRDESDVKLDEARKPADILSFMGLEAGDAVADIFAGGGYYSEIMGQAVGLQGNVVAVNPPQFVSSDQAKAKWAGLISRQSNVSLSTSQLGDYAPAANSYDFAMMHLVYHDLYWESEKFKMARTDPAAFLSRLYTGMKPGGVVAVIDHVGGVGETRAVVEKTHRIHPDDVKADFNKAGFVLEAENDIFINSNDDLEKNVFDPAVRGKTSRFAMRFRKPG